MSLEGTNRSIHHKLRPTHEPSPHEIFHRPKKILDSRCILGSKTRPFRLLAAPPFSRMYVFFLLDFYAVGDDGIDSDTEIPVLRGQAACEAEDAGSAGHVACTLGLVSGGAIGADVDDARAWNVVGLGASERHVRDTGLYGSEGGCHAGLEICVPVLHRIWGGPSWPTGTDDVGIGDQHIDTATTEEPFTGFRYVIGKLRRVANVTVAIAQMWKERINPLDKTWVTHSGLQYANNVAFVAEAKA